MHAAIAVFTGAAVALSIAAAASAQNLVVNGDFGDDILGWDNLDAAKQWNAFDPFSDPLSGSLRLSNAGSGGSVFVDQCVALEPDVAYAFQLWRYAFQSGGGNGRADARVRWFTGSTCSGDLADIQVYQSAVQGEWEHVDEVVTAPADAASANVELGARKFGEGESPELLV